MFRATSVRLAQSVSKRPLNLDEASATLLPPIPILRSHRKLPPDMRSLGDNYIKSEYRRHKDITNKVHIIGFLSQWKVYYDQMQKEEGFRGRPLDRTTLEKMSEEQLGQLYEVMHAAKDVWKPVTPKQDGVGNTEPSNAGSKSQP
ncbi:ACN9-domain-containing protein [Trametes gibbosa]|nr:ACN9-domain-containing protein [Trametes gibbosa]